MQSCFSPIASASTAAPHLHPLAPRLRPLAPRLRLLAPRLRPLQLLVATCVRLLPDCVHFSCCSRARLHPLQLLLPVCLRFQLLLPDCARFSCCSPLASTSAAAPDRVHFGCYSPIASASTAAPRLRPLQLLLTRLRPLRDCCSPIACIRLLDSSPRPGPMFLNILRGVRGSVNCSTKVERH